jgi:hypothetical protein
MLCLPTIQVSMVAESSWNVMAHGDARERKWKGNWRMEWVASTLHTTSEHGVTIITTADAHTSAANSRLNWRLRRFKWTLRRNLVSAGVITIQTQSTWPLFQTWPLPTVPLPPSGPVWHLTLFTVCVSVIFNARTSNPVHATMPYL